MKISIKVFDENDKLLAYRDALSWESASESLGKLERYLGVAQTRTKVDWDGGEIEQTEEKEDLLAQEETEHEQSE